jgi:hypothetical protein
MLGQRRRPDRFAAGPGYDLIPVPRRLRLDWKRVIVGDAFTLPSKDFNFYRDLFLLWPFLLFSVAAITNFLRRGVNHREGVEFLGLAIACMLLAREKLGLIGISLAFCFLQSLWSLVVRHDLVGLWVGFATGALLVLYVRLLKDYKPKVDWPKGQSVVTLVLGLCSLGLTILVFRWIGH